MSLTDARAKLPSLISEPADLEKDAQMLRKLAHWCQRYTPVTAADGQDGILLDITGAAHLLGGELALLRDLTSKLEQLGFTCRLGLAATPGAAWALARFSPKQLIPPHKQLAAPLSPLPIEALRLDEFTIQNLKRLGLKRIGQLLDIPRQSLERRFNTKNESAAVLKRLDQCLGTIQEPLIPLMPPPLHYEQLSFSEPLTQTDAFYGALDKLLQALCSQLEKNQKGARALTFCAYHTDGGVCRLSVQTARPSREAAHFAHLFKDKVETINPGFGVDVISLGAHVTEPLRVRQTALGKEKKQGRITLAVLIDRLSNRLGPHAITRKATVQSHIPERAESSIPPLASISWQHRPSPARPLRLFAFPEPIEVIAEVPDGPPRMFRWRRVMRRIVKASGPERIAAEWWRDQVQRHRTRDYYTLEDEQGRRYWLYREGLYDDQSENARAPEWHMHGVFA